MAERHSGIQCIVMQKKPIHTSREVLRLSNLNTDLVGTEGLEPSRIAPQVPKTCASANSATSPCNKEYPLLIVAIIGA